MQRKSWRNFDPWMVVCALALVSFGLLVIRSATLLADRPVSRQLLTQGGYAAVGIAAMMALALLDYRVLGAFAAALYAGAIALLALVPLVGQSAFGAQRWLGVGWASFQPSEFAKVAVILCLGWFLASRGEEIGSAKTVGISLGIVALPTALVY